MIRNDRSAHGQRSRDRSIGAKGGPRRSRRRYVVGGVASAVLAATAAGTAGASAAPSAVTSRASSGYWANLIKQLHTAKITITVGDWGTGAAAGPNNADLKLFEKEYPNITVKPDTLSFWVNGSDGEAWYTAMAGGNIPTVSVLPFTEPTHMISGGYSANVAPELKALGWSQYMNPVITKLLQRGNKIYGLDESYYVMGLAIDPIVFKKVGLWNSKEGIPEAPTTWSQLLADARLIKRKDPGVDPFNMGLSDTDAGWEQMNITRSYGCVPETKVDGKWTATFDSAACVKGYQIVKDLKYPTEVIEPNYDQVQQTTLPEKWAANDIGMMLWTDGSLESFEEQAKMKADQYSMWPSPAPPGHHPVPVLGGQYETFAPKDTPLEILAGIAWVELQQGVDPLGGATFLKNARAVYKTDEKLYPGISLGAAISSPISTTAYSANAPAVKELNQAAPPVNLINKYFSAYLASFKYGLAEPPEYTQQFYQMMADASQEMLASPSSNISSILKKYATEFQSEYLDSSS